MGTLLRAFLEGVGWHVGREAAKEALDQAQKARCPRSEPAAPDPRALASERRARAKAEAREAKERANAMRREKKALDDELRALKKRVNG